MRGRRAVRCCVRVVVVVVEVMGVRLSLGCAGLKGWTPKEKWMGGCVKVRP